MPGPTMSLNDDPNFVSNKQEVGQGQADADASVGLTALEKESSSRENNVAKIRVVVSVLNLFVMLCACIALLLCEYVSCAQALILVAFLLRVIRNSHTLHSYG